jgi:hypothetical protein
VAIVARVLLDHVQVIVRTVRVQLFRGVFADCGIPCG